MPRRDLPPDMPTPYEIWALIQEVEANPHDFDDRDRWRARMLRRLMRLTGKREPRLTAEQRDALAERYDRRLRRARGIDPNTGRRLRPWETDPDAWRNT